MFFSCESLLLRGGDDLPVLHEARRGVVIVGAKSQNIHFAIAPAPRCRAVVLGGFLLGKHLANRRLEVFEHDFGDEGCTDFVGVHEVGHNRALGSVEGVRKPYHRRIDIRRCHRI